MDKKIQTLKQKLNLEKKRSSSKKDAIYCKTSAQNTENSINININIKTEKFKHNNKGLKSANYKISTKSLKNNKSNNNYNNKSKDIQFKTIFLNTNINNNIYTTKYNNYSKPKKNLRIVLTEPDNKLKLSNSNIKLKSKNKDLMPYLPKVNKKLDLDNNIFELYPEISNEYQNLKKIWKEIGVTSSFMKNFEIINKNVNDNNKKDILEIIKSEVYQINQFKNEIIKTMKLIQKREEEINNIKNLDQKYSNLNIYLNFQNDSDSDTKNILENNKDIISEKNTLEKEIHKSLASVRLKGINVVSQIRKLKMKYSYLINIGKIDINYLNDKFGYDKNYLIKLISDLDFLSESNLKNLYHFSPKGQDPFLLSISGTSQKNLLSNTINSKNSKDNLDDFFTDFEDNELNSKEYFDINNNDNAYDNTYDNNNKKYKILPINKEIWNVVKKLVYYLSQEILFNMVKMEQDDMNNLSTHHINYENSSLNHNTINNTNSLNNNNINTKENSKRASKVIANLKSFDSNKYNKLFFNKTLVNNKSKNKKIIQRSDKMNLFLKLNKDIELFDKKLRGEKNINLDDNSDQYFKDIYNILHKDSKNIKEDNLFNSNDKEKEKNIKDMDNNSSKNNINNELKKLVIRTNTSDYFKEKKPEEKEKIPPIKIKTKRPTIIVEEKIEAKRQKELSIYNEVERRVNIEVEKKIKSITDTITSEMKQKLEINKKKLEEESQKIITEKKKLEKFLETQKNLRELEEQRRAKLALEREKKEELEEKRRMEKIKEMERERIKMRKEIEDKFMKEIERRFKEQEEKQKIWEKEEKIKREKLEKE